MLHVRCKKSESELEKILILMGPTFTYYAFLTKLTKSREKSNMKITRDKSVELSTLFQLLLDQALI